MSHLTGMKYLSRGFLHPQSTTKMPSPSRAFILDFDGTITTKDTISTLFNFALSTQASKGHDLTTARNEILSKYSEDYSKHVKDYLSAKGERKSIAQEIEYYRSLKAVEIRSFERVSASGLFKGIANHEWEEFGRDAVRKGEVVVKKGFGDFVEKAEESGGVWGLVSVNFSSPFIRGVLKSVGLDISKVQVLANHPDENGVLWGPETRGGDHHSSVVVTSDDKLASMKTLLNSCGNEFGRQALEVFYVGDSGTDLECLTEQGTTGIVMAQDRKGALLETLQRARVDVRHIENYQPDQAAVIYWAGDFEEIARYCFLGPQRNGEPS